MKASKVRVVVAAVVFIVLCIGLIAGVQLGTLSGFGWGTVAALCPLGALTTMIATKTLVPHAVVSLVAMALLALLVGRAFCGWACPVPLLERARGRGFGIPLASAVVERARSVTGAREAVLLISPDNTASQSVARALGARPTGEQVRHPADGTRQAERWLLDLQRSVP